jgi:hypothetical protein
VNAQAGIVAVFIHFRKEAYTLSAARRVMLRATSVMFGIVRACCGNLWKIRNCYRSLPNEETRYGEAEFK